MKKYTQSGVPEDERVTDPCEYMADLAQTFLPLKKWNFKESARFITTSPKVVYECEWCRLKFIWGRWEMYTGNSISILYGRLYAPDDKYRMIWNGEECRCWHGLTGTSPVLDYLDGLTPQESVNRKGFPRILEQQRQSDLWKELAGKRRQPELAVRLEAKIWEHYGLRLFELFDLRRPDLWEQYRQWLRAHYVAKGNSEERDKQFGVAVPYYRVC